MGESQKNWVTHQNASNPTLNIFSVKTKGVTNCDWDFRGEEDNSYEGAKANDW